MGAAGRKGRPVMQLALHSRSRIPTIFNRDHLIYVIVSSSGSFRSRPPQHLIVFNRFFQSTKQLNPLVAGPSRPFPLGAYLHTTRSCRTGTSKSTPERRSRRRWPSTSRTSSASGTACSAAAKKCSSFFLHLYTPRTESRKRSRDEPLEYRSARVGAGRGGCTWRSSRGADQHARTLARSHARTPRTPPERVRNPFADVTFPSPINGFCFLHRKLHTNYTRTHVPPSCVVGVRHPILGDVEGVSYRANRLEGAVQAFRVDAVRHVRHRLGRQGVELLLHVRLEDHAPQRRVVVAAFGRSFRLSRHAFFL